MPIKGKEINMAEMRRTPTWWWENRDRQRIDLGGDGWYISSC